MMTTDLTNTADLIDLRDVIERIEGFDPDLDDDQAVVDEYNELTALLNDLKGYGGDEQWRGDWYPITLIRDSYFTDYARQLAEDIGAIDPDASWPNNCIDWEQASRELRMDYSAVDYAGTMYWYR